MEYRFGARTARRAIPHAAMTERSRVSVNTKRVFYVKYLADPVYADILGRREDVRLDRLENESGDDDAKPILAAAHVYQVGSARDEIARRFHVDAALIARMPKVLVVSTSGVGYDTVDVKACTNAGILVVNQAGGNREAVAEHALGMLIALSKRIPETNQVMRRERLVDRVAYMGNDVLGKTIGIIGLGNAAADIAKPNDADGLGNVGSRIAQLCRGQFAMQVLAYDPYLTAEVCAKRGAE